VGNNLKWTSIATAAIAGLLIGFAVTTFAYRHRMLRVPGGHTFVDRLDRELKLSPDQHHQIEELLQGTRSKMSQLHEEYHQRRHQLIAQTHEQIRAVLNPEQQKIFDSDFSLKHAMEHDHHRDNE
jgi:ElaB/YqjD/DUF883 family membrane-anchored ribosome-binding protein